MITGDSEYLQRIVESHVCPKHGNKLVVAWYAKGNTYVIRCSEGHYPEEVTREMTPTQEYKAGEREAHAPGLDLLVREDLGTGKAISAAQEIALLNYADRYGLDAYRSHVMYMYGKLYIGIDGYLYHAKMTGTTYQLNSRPLEEGERQAMQLGEKDHGWKAEIKTLPDQGYFVGIGIVTNEEMTAKSDKNPNQLRAPVVAAHPWQLAQKRAEWQALRRAFPIGETEEENIEARDKGSIP